MLERRRYERVAFFSRVQLTVLPNGPILSGRSFDISIGGVGIMADTTLARGQAVRVRFRLHNGPNDWIEEDAEGRVAYVHADEDSNRLGIEFVATINASTQPVLAHALDAL